MSTKRAEESYAEYAYRVLRRRILRLSMKPGDVIREKELAEELQISRTPVHEAVLRLRDEGFVEIRPRALSRVALFDLNRINEGLFIRAALDAAVLSAAAGNTDAEMLRRLTESIAKQEDILSKRKTADTQVRVQEERKARSVEAAGAETVLGESGAETGQAGEGRTSPDAKNTAVGSDKDGTDDFLAEDDAFHALLYEAAGKPSALTLVQTATSQLTRMRYLIDVLQSYDYISESISDHKKMLDMIRFGIPEQFALSAFIAEHMRGFQSCLPEIRMEYPGYFL